MKVEGRLLSVDDTGERLGVSEWTITDWIKAGRLKGTKIGKFWRVRESDLEAFIANPPPLKRVALAAPQAPSQATNGTSPPPIPSPVTPQARKKALFPRLLAMEAEGLSHRAMAERLNEAHEPTISGRGRWQPGTMGKLLAGAKAWAAGRGA